MCIALVACATPKKCCSQNFKKYFKFATFYAAANGGNSISDVDVGSECSPTSHPPAISDLISDLYSLKSYDGGGWELSPTWVLKKKVDLIPNLSSSSIKSSIFW